MYVSHEVIYLIPEQVSCFLAFDEYIFKLRDTYKKHPYLQTALSSAPVTAPPIAFHSVEDPMARKTHVGLLRRANSWVFPLTVIVSCARLDCQRVFVARVVCKVFR